MDKNEKTEADEVKVAMLENDNEATSNEVSDRSQQLQCTRSNGKDTPAKPKVSQKMEYLRANKVLVATVLISAAIILAIVVAMLATDGRGGHHHHSRAHHSNVTKQP
ncbi:hypothetical protein DNTS_021306 [Danionella cerebrum]|uniref:Uncharacterized protein n=1 Tax=Danionella cerebrum TaxID=2873325 RepID=A0A553MMB7_9TELE|nr:hypothetical protein DNTS_021306 [Danionella translucida]